MPPKPSSSIVLDVNAGNPAEQPEPLHVEAAPDDPFRILIIGAFSGRQNRPALDLRRPRRIDRDNFDDVLAGMHVQATLSLGAAEIVKLTFATLADFEPDSIFKRCELFRSPAPVPSTGNERIGSAHLENIASAISSPRVAAEAAQLVSGSLLDEIVEQADARGPAEPKGGLQSVVERLVAPHVFRDSGEDRAAQNHAYSALMRAILHHPQFQALEAAWRALDLLARGLDTDGALSLHILDVTRGELERRLDDLRPQLTPREPWAAIAGNYVFDNSARDAALLQRIGALARRAGAPWMAESAPPGDEDESMEWRALRGSPDSRWIGLALPRFLARMPYGSGTCAIESFPFEEIPGLPEHSDFLWANPAFACAWLLGRAFNEYGWRFRPGVVRQMEGLPYYSYRAEGEMRSQPCAEVLLTDHQIEFIQERGLMALASMKNRDVVTLMRFQSIADPVSALAGRWRRSVNFDDR